MLKIYGYPVSLPSNKVRFTANHIGLDYDYMVVDLVKGEQMNEGHKKLHPAGKVPVMDDNGFILFESGAIIKYLAAKHGSGLYPEDIKQRAHVDKWTDFATLHIGSSMNRVFFNRILAPVVGVEVDERSMNDGIGFLERYLPVADKQLSHSGHLAGNDLTLADITLLSMLDPAEASQVDLSPYQSLSSWRRRLQNEDFYTRCHKSYSDVLKSAA